MSSTLSLNTIAMDLASPNVAAAKSGDPKKVKDAAQQFEALLIEQMLRAARASGSGDFTGSAEDQSGSALTEMAEQQFAQLLASNGGIGMAKLVASGLAPKSPVSRVK